MHLMYYLDKNGRRVYTLKVRLSTKQRLDAKAYLLQQKTAPDGTPTYSAHPARFSPDDKYSKHRVTLKRRFGILPPQLPDEKL